MDSTLYHLFVYGSLKRGFSNVHFLDGQRFLREATTQPIYRMYDYGGYPGLVHDPESGYAICGELWEVDARCMVGVDYLEGVDSGLYYRAEAQLAPPDAEMRDVILYLYAREVIDLPEITGGFWEKEWDGILEG